MMMMMSGIHYEGGARNRERHKKWSVVDVYLIVVTTGVHGHVWGLVSDGYC